MPIKKILFGFVILSAAIIGCAAVISPQTNGELLDELDSELLSRTEYVRQRKLKIDSIKRLIEADSLHAHTYYVDLGLQTEGLNIDSAIAVFNEGYRLAINAGDSVVAQRSLICRVKELGLLGATPEAIADLNAISEIGIYPENQLLFCEVGRDLYYTLAEILEGSNAHEQYMLQGLSIARQYQTFLSTDSYEYKLNRALIFYAEKNDPMFIAHLTEIANEISPDEPTYPIVMTALGGRELLLNKIDEAIRYLALAAINDVRQANRYGTSLLRLGRALYDTDDLVKSHRYLSIALDDALAAGVHTNCLMVSSALMPVAQELHDRDHVKFMWLSCFIVSLVVTSVLLGHLYLVKRRRSTDMERVKLQLANANMSKDTYISEFMNLCSSYMESLEDFHRMCRRKITAGQSDDLLNFIKGGKIMDDQRKKFDDIFDDSFLAIYPTFIDEVNKLLLPDKRIIVPEKNMLTTELRVLAFTRLGVDDTAQVARFLGVTLNTIYTYRNKLRNKAISRETFDTDVMKIGAIP